MRSSRPRHKCDSMSSIPRRRPRGLCNSPASATVIRRSWVRVRASTARPETRPYPGVPGFLPAPGEQVYLPMEAQLFEWRKSAGHYVGGLGLRGVSLRVPGTESARAYWGGLSRSHWVEGEEGWSPIDQGTAIVTSGRIAFRGLQGFMEWPYPKLVGLEIDPNLNALALQVSHRRKTHILIVEDVLFFLFKLEAAVARSRGGSAVGPDRPELPDELAGEHLEAKAGLIPQVIEGIEDEKKEAYLDRAAKIRSVAVASPSRRDEIRVIKADQRTKIEELDELLRGFEAIQARTWEPTLELLADEEECSSPAPPSDPPSKEARRQLPPPTGGRQAWSPDDLDAARHVWFNLDANSRTLFNLMLGSDHPVAWEELAGLLGPEAGDDTVFGTFGHAATLPRRSVSATLSSRRIRSEVPNTRSTLSRVHCSVRSETSPRPRPFSRGYSPTLLHASKGTSCFVSRSSISVIGRPGHFFRSTSRTSSYAEDPRALVAADTCAAFTVRIRSSSMMPSPQKRSTPGPRVRAMIWRSPFVRRLARQSDSRRRTWSLLRERCCVGSTTGSVSNREIRGPLLRHS